MEIVHVRTSCAQTLILSFFCCVFVFFKGFRVRRFVLRFSMFIPIKTQRYLLDKVMETAVARTQRRS